MIPELMYQALLTESKKIGAFGHGFTYGGHPVAAAVAVKAIEIYERDRMFQRAAKLGQHFQARLAALNNHALVGEARGLGLIGGVELVANKNTRQGFAPTQGVGPRAVRFAEDEGLIARAVMGDVLTLCPPLIITAAEIDDLFDRLGRALDKHWIGFGATPRYQRRPNSSLAKYKRRPDRAGAVLALQI